MIGMCLTEPIRLIDNSARINDNYVVTNCCNGFVVEVSGQDKKENCINAKFVFRTLGQEEDTVHELAWMPES
jgi:hypothetical protein